MNDFSGFRPMASLHWRGPLGVLTGLVLSAVRLLAASGALDTTFDPGSGANNTVWAVAGQQDGKVLIVGAFTNVNGQARERIARLNGNGSLDTNFVASITGFRSEVLAVVVQSDQKILVGGNFSLVNGTARGSIARLNTDGTLDSGFMNGLAGISGVVRSIVCQDDGKIVVGGDFSTVNGTAWSDIARLTTNGSLDTNFQTFLSSFGNDTQSVAVQNDGKVLMGGFFSTVNGVVQNSVARFNTNGSLDTNFVGLTSQSLVGPLAVQPDGKVLIGGFFTTINDQPRNRIARLNSNGSLDTEFLNGLSGANGGVRAVVVQDDGKVLMGGEFNLVNGVARSGIARLNRNGSLDTGFLEGLAGIGGFQASIAAVALQGDSGVLLGGTFTSIHGVALNRIARLQGDPQLRFVPPIRLINDVFEAGVESPPGVEYVIYSSTNLSDWLPVHTNNAPFLFTNATAGQDIKFYRALIR
jgi:uncharacterized delta-60 repeat protein